MQCSSELCFSGIHCRMIPQVSTVVFSFCALSTIFLHCTALHFSEISQTSPFSIAAPCTVHNTVQCMQLHHPLKKLHIHLCLQLTRDQCTVCASESGRAELFFYYSLYNGRGIFHSDGCVSSTHGWPPDLYFNCYRTKTCVSSNQNVTKIYHLTEIEILVEIRWKTNMILGGRCPQSARSLQISKMLKTVAIPTRLIATSSINHRKSIYQHQSRVIENIYICRLPIFPRDQMQNNANINLKIEYIFDFQIPFQNSRCLGTMEDG